MFFYEGTVLHRGPFGFRVFEGLGLMGLWVERVSDPKMEPGLDLQSNSHGSFRVSG